MRKVIVLSYLLCNSAIADPSAVWNGSYENRQAFKETQSESKKAWAEHTIQSGWADVKTKKWKRPGSSDSGQDWAEVIRNDVYNGLQNNNWGFNFSKQRAQGELNGKIDEVIGGGGSVQ